MTHQELDDSDRRSQLRLEQWPLNRLILSDKNPRTHTAEQVDQIAGEGRFRAAQSLGLRSIPVIKLEHLSQVQRRALAIADNQLALNAGWDERMLREQLAALKDERFDLHALGFDDLELARQLADADSGDQTEEDEVPPTPIAAVTKRNDL